MAKSFPDLNNDGEVTRADVLKGRGVFKKGGKVGEKIPAKKLAKAAKAPGKLGQRARLAQTLKKMK